MTTGTPTRIHVDHDVAKRLGNWTAANTFEVKARYGSVMLDLRSPQIEGDIEIDADLDHAVVKLLVADDAVVDASDLRWTGRGQVKDMSRPKHATGRVIRIVGNAGPSAEFRVHRGGVAMLTAMLTREFLEDARRAHRAAAMPTVADPAGAQR
jgi:hypothetical protein